MSRHHHHTYIGEDGLPTGRGDTAMIEQAAEAIARARGLKWEHCDLEMSDEYRADARAAAAVIVPATAERIAAVYADRAVRYRRSRGDYIDGCHGWHIADHYEQLALELRKGDNPALTFAAGLSAGATGGDGGE